MPPPGIQIPNVSLTTVAHDWTDLTHTVLRALTIEEGRSGFGQIAEDLATRAVGTIMAYSLKWQTVAAKLLLEAWSDAQREQGDIVGQLAATGISDLFDIPVSPAEAVPGRGAAGAGLRNKVGQAVLDGLLSKIRPTGALGPDDGLRAAEAVLGQTVGLGIEGWLEGLYFGGPLGDYFNGAIADLDDVVAASAGLGSAARRAIGPVLRVLVAEPLTRWLNAQYRPRIYNEGQAVRALRLNAITPNEYYETMGELGWTREKAGVLEQIGSKELSKDDLLRLRELSLIDETEMATLLRASGYYEDVSRILARSLVEDRVRAWRGAHASVVRDMYRDGELGAGEARAQLGELGYSDLEIRTLMNVADLERNRVRAVSEADMETAYVEGLVSLGELHGYYLSRGYDMRGAVIQEQLAAIRKTRVKK